MKPLNTQIHVLQVLLIIAATTLTLVGFLFSSQNMTAVLGTIDYGEAHYPVIVNFTHLAYFLGFLATYLSFEFYGFKTGIFTVLGLSLMMTGLYFLFFVLNDMADTYRIPFFDKRILGFFVYPYPDFVAGLTAFFGAQTLALSIAAVIKKITRNYFMFLRYPLGALAGFAFYVAVSTYLTTAGTLTMEQMLAQGVPPAAEFLIFIFASVVPLYLIRLFLGIFRGRDKKNKTQNNESPAQPGQNAAVAPAPSAPEPTQISTPPSRRSSGLWQALLILPVLLGASAGLIFFGVIQAYHYNLILDVPYFVIAGHNAPLESSLLMAASVALALMAARFSIHLLGRFWARKQAAKSATPDTTISVMGEEDTVSEKTKPQEKLA